MADDNKNPLDVLEELLNDSSGKSNSSGSDVKGGEPKPPEKTQAEIDAELEAQRLEFEKKQQEQQVVDDQKMVEQRQAIVGIKDSKEYQARVQQEEEKKVETERNVIAEDGFEIDQLDHTKV